VLIVLDELLRISYYGVSHKNLVFSETVSTITNKLMFGEKFRMKIRDSSLNCYIYPI